MPKLDVKNISGKTVGSIDLDDAVFGAEVNEHLLWEVVKWQLAKRRAGTASTKRLGEVRGSSKKVWKQKGTGQARQGSRQAPHWVGGGSVFGPKPRDYEYKLPRKAKKARAARGAVAPRVGERSSSSSTASDLGPKARPSRSRRRSPRSASRSRPQGPDRRRQGQRATSSAARATSPRRSGSRPRASTSTTSSATRRSSSRRPRSRQIDGRPQGRRRERVAMRDAQSIIKRPLLTEKTARLRETGGAAASPRRGRDLRAAGRVRGRARREQDRDPAARSQNAVQGHASPTSARSSCAARRSAIGRFAGRRPSLEEGVRDAQARRQHRVLRGSLSHGDQAVQADLAGPPRHVHARTSARSRRASPRRACSRTSRRTAGRNNHGRITSRFRGGGHKQRYRIDRLQAQQDRRARRTCSAIEYDPNRSARIALLQYADGEKAYILAPQRLGVGDTGDLGEHRRHQAGQLAAAPLHPDRHRRSTPSSSRSAAARSSAARPAPRSR